ncbi:hypothetical protein [Streptomyces sp. NPDC058695]|uniref:hypothetical protein n=1 Tax=Streptomyces sp. NPDC058695 TaxID=3346604 RepID=UPI0036646B2F
MEHARTTDVLIVDAGPVDILCGRSAHVVLQYGADAAGPAEAAETVRAEGLPPMADGTRPGHGRRPRP